MTAYEAMNLKYGQGIYAETDAGRLIFGRFRGVRDSQEVSAGFFVAALMDYGAMAYWTCAQLKFSPDP